MESQRITVYYDGVCNLCSGLMDTVDKSSHGSSFVHADISQGSLPEGVTQAEAMRDVHVVDQAGRLHKGADAVFNILEQYPRWRLIVWMGRLPVFNLVAAGLYRAVEKTRYWIFGRKHV